MYMNAVSVRRNESEIIMRVILKKNNIKQKKKAKKLVSKNYNNSVHCTLCTVGLSSMSFKQKRKLKVAKFLYFIFASVLSLFLPVVVAVIVVGRVLAAI